MNRNILFVAAVAALALVAPAANASGILYFNNPDYNGGFSSQNDTTGLGNFATVWSGFDNGGAASVDEVAWIGSYFNPPEARTIDSFTLSFYTDNAGAVGSFIGSRTIAGNAGETFLGLDNISDPTYLYDTLITPIDVNAKGWLSVVANTSGTTTPQWGWETGEQVVVSYQEFLGSTTQLQTAEAFALYGNLTPEPTSMAVLGLGVVALIRRRKASK